MTTTDNCWDANEKNLPEVLARLENMYPRGSLVALRLAPEELAGKLGEVVDYDAYIVDDADWADVVLVVRFRGGKFDGLTSRIEPDRVLAATA